MENVTYTHIHIGLEKPVKILQVTDIHITKANDSDTPRHHELMKKRTEVFRAEGNYPPKAPEEYFLESIELAKKEDALLICTGDAIDIHTNGNLEYFRELIQDQDMMFTPGGHEHQRRCVCTMEEEYPYWETIRPKLEAEFPQFDLYFESRIIGGLNIITADNSLDYYAPRTLEAFKRELEKGLPIIVFSHDYIWDRQLNYKEPYHPNIRLTSEDYKASHEMIDLLLHHPLVITTFGGHGHRYEEREIDGKLHYATDGLFKGNARMIEIT